MGLRTASVRRPDATVMAPALTETKTATSFKLTTKTQSLDDTSVFIRCENSAKNKEKERRDASFDLSRFEALTSSILCEKTQHQETNGASDNIMSSDFPLSMDHAKMGLQKTGLENVVNSLLKDANTSTANDVVEQILNNLTNSEHVSDLGVHNDDDLMQVIKSCSSLVEGDAIFPLSTGDLTGNLTSLEKALFNEVDMMNINIVEQLIEPTPTRCKDNEAKELITEVQATQARLERRFDFLVRRLRKVQVRYMGQHIGGEVAGVYEHVHRTLRRMKDSSTTSDAAAAALDLSAPAVPDEPLKPISHGAAKTLVKKLETARHTQSNSAARQRLSARYFGSGSIEPAAFRCNTATGSNGLTGGASGMTTLPTWPAADKASLQQTAGQLQAQFGLVQAQLDSDATLSSSGGESCDEMQSYGNPHQQYLAIQKRAAWKYSASRATIASRWSWLLAQIADLEYRIRQHTDLHRQMRSHKGAVVLADLGGGGTQGNGSAAGGGGGTQGSGSAGGGAAAVNGYRGALPGATATTSAAKGDGVAAGTVVDASHADPTPTSTTTTEPYLSARTRPLHTATFTKRKLVQTSGLHVASKKAARPATVRCACVAIEESNCCAVCTGRPDATHPRDPTDHLSRMERIALLDGAYHPVVSLPEDTSISIHMEAIMKSNEWQQRSSRSSLKAMKYAIKADRMNEKQGIIDQRPKKGLEHRKKYNRLIKSNTVNALTAKLKTGKVRGRKPGTRITKKHRHKPNRHHLHYRTDTTPHHHHHQHHRTNHHDADDYLDDLLDDEAYGIAPLMSGAAGGGELGSMSRSGSPLMSTQAISGYGRRNRVDSYDIDNIVIPYSVAASTRVEKLEYKEILTPKWRLVDNSNLPPIKYESKNNGVVKITSQENEVSDLEDVSEEAVHVRHDKSEQEEKRKFLSYLKLPFGYSGGAAQRRLHHRRTDSRAESSGANTPDHPMSPSPVPPAMVGSGGDGGDTPVASPPALVGGVAGAALVQQHEELPESLRNLPLSSLSSLRRRTISQSRFMRDMRLNSQDSNDGTEPLPQHHQQQQQPPPPPVIVEVVPPFDRRQFPLSEENYDKMVRGMPDNHRNQPMNVRNQDSGGVGVATTSGVADGTGGGEKQQSGQRRDGDYVDSESTESAFGDEDPNDPEWDEEVACRDLSRFKR